MQMSWARKNSGFETADTEWYTQFKMSSTCSLLGGNILPSLTFAATKGRNPNVHVLRFPDKHVIQGRPGFESPNWRAHRFFQKLSTHHPRHVAALGRTACLVIYRLRSLRYQFGGASQQIRGE